MTDASQEQATVIGRGIRVEGKITGSAPVEVWGEVEGKTDTGGFLRICEGGRVGGEIEAVNVVVEGRVEGTITAREKIELGPTAEVKGDVQAKTLAIADGSFFQGRVRMDESGGAPKQVRFQEKRQGS